MRTSVKVVNFYLYIVIILLDSCITCHEKETEGILQKMYQEAVIDASNPTPEEIDSNLISICSAIQDSINDDLYYKVLTYIPQSYLSSYKEAMNANNSLKINFDMWVTIAPELRNFCKGIRRMDSTYIKLRLNQLLGLPPDANNNYLVELWVKQNDIKRPCPDWEPTDSICSLNFPDSVSPDYRTWFNEKRAYSYADPGNVFPFTQLGYTYDWGGNKDERGLSEFVILGSLAPKYVFVDSIYSIVNYCR